MYIVYLLPFPKKYISLTGKLKVKTHIGHNVV